LFTIASLSVTASWAHVHHAHGEDGEDLVNDESSDTSTLIERFLSNPSVAELEMDGELGIRLKVLRADSSNWRNINQLGWLLVERARLHQDESFYSLSERLAALNLNLNGRRPETMALWIHVLLQEHRFDEARIAAHELVEIRGEPKDYALRGDAAMEQGDLEEGKDDYLEFLEKSPSLPSYARWGHLNWLLGNELEAVDAWKEAIERGGGANEESVAWCKAKLAEVYLCAGELEEANRWAGDALAWNNEYGFGRFIKGRIDWFLGDPNAALESLEIAARIDPLPERLWWLEDVYRRVGKNREADDLRERLIEYGPSIDRRATALYLLTRGVAKQAALDLGRAESESRADAATLDALGYCWLRIGDFKQAESALTDSGEKGRVPGRRSLHEGMLAWETGDADAAQKFWSRAYEARFAMTPSEIEVLKTNLAKANAAILENEKLFAKGRLENE